MNIGKIDTLLQVFQTFETDSVHLNQMSGKLFLKTILFYTEAFFNSEVIELDDDTKGMSEQESEARLELFKKTRGQDIYHRDISRKTKGRYTKKKNPRQHGPS